MLLLDDASAAATAIGSFLRTVCPVTWLCSRWCSRELELLLALKVLGQRLERRWMIAPLSFRTSVN
jgi:hypothetical protein